MPIPGAPDALASLIRHLIEAVREIGQAGADVGTFFAGAPIVLGGALKQIDTEEQAELFNGLREVFPEFVESRNSAALLSRMGLTTAPYPGRALLPSMYGRAGLDAVSLGGFSPIGVSLGTKGKVQGPVSIGLLSVDSIAGGHPWAFVQGPGGPFWTDVSPSVMGILKPKQTPPKSV
jgi:hypothetical protein